MLFWQLIGKENSALFSATLPTFLTKARSKFLVFALILQFGFSFRILDWPHIKSKAQYFLSTYLGTDYFPCEIVLAC